MSKRITFLVDKVVDDNRKGTPDEEAYKAGKSYTMSDASARHFIVRGLAEPAKPKRQAVSQEPASQTPAASEATPTDTPQSESQGAQPAA